MAPKTIIKKKDVYTSAVGRRKAAVATVKLYPTSGQSTINQKPVNSDNPAFMATHTEKKYHFVSIIRGGGKEGQIEALTLAIARALKIVNPEMGPALRSAGLLSVDARVRERRKVGTGGKARRAKQSPKR